jgi:hypothetical protein
MRRGTLERAEKQRQYEAELLASARRGESCSGRCWAGFAPNDLCSWCQRAVAKCEEQVKFWTMIVCTFRRPGEGRHG